MYSELQNLQLVERMKGSACHKHTDVFVDDCLLGHCAVQCRRNWEYMALDPRGQASSYSAP
jgi:hypothetical protein